MPNDDDIEKEINEYWPYPDPLTESDISYIKELVKLMEQAGHIQPIYQAVQAFINETYDALEEV